MTRMEVTEQTFPVVHGDVQCVEKVIPFLSMEPSALNVLQ
jgi:hypothetical protein